MNIFVDTKNAPKDLKCKINDNIFFENWGSKKGGGPTFGENSQKILFFLLAVAPKDHHSVLYCEHAMQVLIPSSLVVYLEPRC